MSNRPARHGPKRPQQRLAAALIVRDEAAHIGSCLDALRPVVDEVHVHDTGSTDDTPVLAGRSGAIVTSGPWTDDFAAARNAALEGWTADWVLSVDADEIVIADRAALRRFLADTKADVLRITIENGHGTDDSYGDESYRHVVSRLFRPAVARWHGRVHEQLVGDRDLVRADIPPGILRLQHVGYADEEVVKGKGRRNAALAQAALTDLLEHGVDPSDPRVMEAMLALGRSYYTADDAQRAVDVFETIRDHFPGSHAWAVATDLLTQLMTAHRMTDVALALILDLRQAGQDAMYCDWLEAHCLARSGHFTAARELLAGVTAVVDLNGSRHPAATLEHFGALLDEAIAEQTAA